jgi:hypothetical protein
VERAAKFPDKKSFVVAAILRATGGGRMALCMEDPAHWPAQRQDYQHNCLVWVCTLPSLHVVQPEEGVSPENVSMLCRAINSLRKGGTRHLSTFSLPRETKQVLFPKSKVGSGAADPPVDVSQVKGARVSDRIIKQKDQIPVVPTQTPAPKKTRKKTPRGSKPPGITAPPASKKNSAPPLRLSTPGAASRDARQLRQLGAAHQQEEPNLQAKATNAENTKVLELEKKVL